MSLKDKIRAIEITFAAPVPWVEGVDRLLQDIADMFCKAYEQENPDRTMWPAGIGSRPNMFAIFSDDHENMFNPEVYSIDCQEREASITDLKNRHHRPQDWREDIRYVNRPMTDTSGRTSRILDPDVHVLECGSCGEGYLGNHKRRVACVTCCHMEGL